MAATGHGREKVNLIEYNDEERSLPEVKRGTRERKREGGAAAEKAAFGLAGLTHSRRYTATNDDVSLPLRKRSRAEATAASHSAFC